MMKERHLYTTDVSEIQSRIEKAGLKNIYENLS